MGTKQGDISKAMECWYSRRPSSLTVICESSDVYVLRSASAWLAAKTSTDIHIERQQDATYPRSSTLSTPFRLCCLPAKCPGPSAIEAVAGDTAS